MPLPIRIVALRRGDRSRLERLTRSRTTPHRVVERAQIVLASAAGEAGNGICERLDVSRPTVTCWLDRYEAEGVAGLVSDRPRSGRPKQISATDEAAIVDRTLQSRPPKDATQWSTRLMAEVTGHHHATIARIWRRHGLKPHLVRTFKLSTDPDFIPKLRDVVGLYLDPPERAVVFAFDEKSQIQALDRTQPGLPMKKGLQDCMPRHRHQEFLTFLRQMARSVAPALTIHVILDNYATHKHPAVKRWLARHPRVQFHFTPTSASWLNLVERFFSELTERRLRRLAVTSVDQLIEAITPSIDQRNEHPTPFVWTAPVRHILKKVNEAKKTLATLH